MIGRLYVAVILMTVWVLTPTYRLSLLWRVPVAVLLAAVAMILFALDDLLGYARRLARRWR